MTTNLAPASRSVSCSHRGLACQYDAVYSRGKPPAPRRIMQRDMQITGQLPSTQPQSQPRDESLDIGPMIDSASEHQRPLNDSSATMLQLAEHVQDVPSGRASPGLEVDGQYSDPTSGLSFLHRAWRRISNNENSQILVGQTGVVEDDQLLTAAGDNPLRKSGQSVPFPSVSKGQQLLELYFDVCIATYRILHRPSTGEWCVAVLTNANLGRGLSAGLGDAKAAVVLSVLAIASFHEEKTRSNSSSSPASPASVSSESQADELFCEAVRLSEQERGFPRLESAQSRLIQVLYLLMSSRFNQAWYTFGHALQIISALGLHRRNVRRRIAPETRDYVEEQCKRRTFWMAYILDKYLGVMFGRPRHYHDDDIDQDFPDSINDEDMLSTGPQTRGTDDCHIDSLIWHAKLAQIAEMISREVYSIKAVPDHARLDASHRLGAKLQLWKASLPPLLGSINPSSLIPSFRRQAIALKLSYCHAVMLAHRPFLLRNTFRDNEHLRALATESLTECISAAQSVLEVVDRMAQEGRLFHAFWWTHYVCFCALVIVYVWTIQGSSNNATIAERHKLLDQAERCLSHLAQATASNSPSRRYSIILQELRTEAKRKTARYRQEQTTRAPTVSHSTTFEMVGAVSPTPLENMQQTWQPLFGSPVDTTTPGLQDFLDDWQTTDWLHLDSSAFGPIADFENVSLAWM